MISSLAFDRVKYPKPKLEDTRPKLPHILGIDSEAYTTGVPFMFCLSNGDCLLPRDIPQVFFEPKYVGANFVIWNMKYDSGAVLYHLPREKMYELWDSGKTRHGEFRYKYIPHKLLRIYKGNKAVSFWDISQFYKSSLDKAARTYLGRGKIELRTKSFTPEYVDRHFSLIRRYCVMDAKLTGELGVYLVDKLEEFGITASTLYSCAGIAFKYFCDRCKVVTAYKHWKYYRHALGYACDAYAGGKFEVTTRGTFTGYEYDITSAYPYEIQNLVDISAAKIVYSAVYQPKAVYGYLRVRIDNHKGLYLPCGVKRPDGSVYYPAGLYYATITKAEYEYLLEVGCPVEIISGYWFFVKRRLHPYRRAIADLFKIKSDVKGKDRMLYNTTKIVMNGYYGKMAQCIEQHDGSILVGSGWNPMYAAVITANTRIAVSRLQNLLGDDCLAVHTDSVITTRPIPRRFLKDRLGAFEYVTYGDGILIACGMYWIKDQGAYKGFIPDRGDTWPDILARWRHRKTIPYRQLHVESWVEAMAKNHPKSRINVFKHERKRVDLNCDSKRTWPSRISALRLLTDTEHSMPKVVVNFSPPKHWNEKDPEISGYAIDHEIATNYF